MNKEDCFSLFAGKAERNRLISMLTNLADKFKKQKWGWAWTSAGRQSDLEKSLNVGGSGYPVSIIFDVFKTRSNYSGFVLCL